MISEKGSRRAREWRIGHSGEMQCNRPKERSRQLKDTTEDWLGLFWKESDGAGVCSGNAGHGMFADTAYGANLSKIG